ncbi:MAG: oligosaccharide flippase family protein [Flavobacterium sp.]
MPRENGFKNYFVYGFGQIINLIAPLLIAPKVISVCGMENWGKVGVAISIFTILSIFIDFGSLLIGVKEISINKNNPLKIQSYLNETYLLRFLILFLLSVLFIASILIINIEIKLYLLGFLLVLAQVFNPIWYYQGIENYKAINKIIFISKTIYIVLIYIFIREKTDYVYMIFILGFSNAFVYCFFLIKIWNERRLSPFKTSIKKIVENIKKEYPIVISNLSISVYINAPILIISSILGNYETGVYKIGDMLLNVFRSYLSVFFTVSFPRFCDVFSESKEKGMKFLKKVNSYNFIFILFGTLILYLSTMFFIDYFNFDSKTKETIIYCSNFLFLPLIIALNIPFYQILIFNFEQKLLSLISFFGVIVMLLACYSLTSVYKLNGSVMSLYLVELFSTISIFVFYKIRKNKNKTNDNLSL